MIFEVLRLLAISAGLSYQTDSNPPICHEWLSAQRPEQAASSYG